MSVTKIKDISCRPDYFTELEGYLEDGWEIIGNNHYVFFIKKVFNK